MLEIAVPGADGDLAAPFSLLINDLKWAILRRKERRRGRRGEVPG